MLKKLRQQRAERIRSLDVSELRSRIDTTKCPTELQAIPFRLNELLGRLEESFDRECAITANVAHELRTPLAGLRATISAEAKQVNTPASDYLCATTF